jgi:Cytidylate kinase-like family
MTVVALSAAYGAAGSRIGSTLAERLEVPFVDRAIALAVAEELDVSVADALAQEQPVGKSLLERMISGFHGADTGAPVPLPADTVTAEDFHRAAREAVLAQAATGAGVILGRGAVAALRDDPTVLRVRLAGPQERRIEQAMQLGHIGRDTAERALRAFDRAHADYLKQFYDADINDPALYHAIIDSTAFTFDACVDLIALAVEALIRPL